MDWLLNALDLQTFAATDLLVVLVLIILEGLLSCDNAVVLALLVKDLPPNQRGKALRYGIWGAYIFRVIALFLAVWVMTIWWIKVVGGLYLAWMAVDYFVKHSGGDKDPAPRPIKRILGLSALWSTVVMVELTDIVFSVDSIAAAVALSNKLWVLILGGFLGILAMRFAAQGFVKLLEKFPRLESCAFAAVGLIGLKLLLEFPLDVVGRVDPLPPDASYTTAQEYNAAVAAYHRPAFAIAHTLTINSSAPSAPEHQRFVIGAEAAIQREAPTLVGDARTAWLDKRANDEHTEAESHWALHDRPFIEVEGWLSSLAVMAIFALGFRRRPTAAIKR
ncbi:MAG: TerC family protein [Planctomycetota bacterium]